MDIGNYLAKCLHFNPRTCNLMFVQEINECLVHPGIPEETYFTRSIVHKAPHKTKPIIFIYHLNKSIT